MIPSFAPRLVREPLGPMIARIDLRDVGAAAEFGTRIVRHLQRVEALLNDKAHDLLCDVSGDLDIAFRDGLAAARSATAYSHLALARVAVTPTPRPPDLVVLRGHIAAAEREANEKIAKKLRTMHISTTREFVALLGGWRDALDRGADRLDPSELARAEAAYAAAASINLDVAWPGVRFDELPTSQQVGATQ